MTADEPTAIRHPKRGKWHRNWRDTGSCTSAIGLYGLDAVERVFLSQTAPEDRCRTCWPTTKGEA